MAVRRPLVTKIARRLDMEYVGGDRRHTRRTVILVRIEDYEKDDGTYCVSIKAKETEEETVGETKGAIGKSPATKDFLCNRIVRLFDPETGEVVEEVHAYFSGIIEEFGGIQPRYWPRPETNPIRTAEPIISFGSDRYAKGWVFGVCDAFRDALDLRDEEDKKAGRMVRTQGLPPQFRFDVGDIFYSPFPWGPETKTAIQVQAADDSEIMACIMTLDNRKVIHRVMRKMAHTVLAEMLRTGNVNLGQECSAKPWG